MKLRQPVYPGEPHEAVRRVRERLGIYPISEEWDERVLQRVRGQQVLLGLYPDGVLDQKFLDAMAL